MRVGPVSRYLVVGDVGLDAFLEVARSIETAREGLALYEARDFVLQPGGLAVLNVDNEHVAAMAARAPGKVWRVSVQGRPDADITARDIRYGPDGASFTVEDSGVGIAPEHIPRLTERFYRVDRSRSRETGGTGLGLAIVKHALARHQATLEIESRPGAGSRFTVHFPAQRLLPSASPSELTDFER